MQKGAGEPRARVPGGVEPSAGSDCGDQGPWSSGWAPVVRPRHCGNVRWGTLGRSIFAQPQRGFVERLPPCVPPRRSPPACYALLVWNASGDPKRGERSSPVAPRARTVGRKPVRRAAATPIDHSGTRTPIDLIPLSRKRGGRSFGAALSEVAIVRTPTSSAGLATGQAMSRSPSGARRFRGWRQRFGARVMPYVGSDRWWLNRLAPLRCLKCTIHSGTEKRKGPLATFTADRSAPRGSLGSVADDPRLPGGTRLALAPRPPGLPPRPVRPTRGAWPGARLQAARCAPRASAGAASRWSSGPFEVEARTQRIPAFYQGKP